MWQDSITSRLIIFDSMSVTLMLKVDAIVKVFRMLGDCTVLSVKVLGMAPMPETPLRKIRFTDRDGEGAESVSKHRFSNEPG